MKVWIAAIILVVLAASTRLPAAGKGDAEAGKAVFTTSCKTCHGPQGEGNPAIAKVLKVTIPPLSSKEVQAKTDEQMKKIVTEGTGKMKPVQGISDKQIQDVIAFVRTLSKS